MESKKDPVKSKALSVLEKPPGEIIHSHGADQAAVVVNRSKDVYLSGYGAAGLVTERNAQLPKYKSWEWESGQNEKPVKILSYTGSLPNQFGNDGDFYVDEMTNMLYGPKVAGVWPETGVLATGLCKRTWIAFTRMRVQSKIPERGFLVRIKAIFRLLIPKSLFRANSQKSLT
jgi:hypothetical protein